ncbi:MAG: PAS domain S-box protein, partial [Candidatus Omnitrophica bacterium]|nr:PAS domain S-box protein [Candidatus Omnitrophota bacterium]
MSKFSEGYKVTEKLLASVVHFSEDSIVITTKDLDPPGPTIIYVNPGFTKMTGYSPHEIIGKTPGILQGPKTDRSILKNLKSSLIEGKVFFGQAINYRKDGSEFWNEWHIEPIRDHSGVVECYVAIQRDITKRKEAEQAIEQKNSALKEILQQIEIEKKNIKEDVFLNVGEVLLPALKKLRRKGSPIDKKYIDILEHNLKNLTSTFGRNVSDKKFKFSPREVEIANLIKSGVSSKEICNMLNISFKTVEAHDAPWICHTLGLPRCLINSYNRFLKFEAYAPESKNNPAY